MRRLGYLLAVLACLSAPPALARASGGSRGGGGAATLLVYAIGLPVYLVCNAVARKRIRKRDYQTRQMLDDLARNEPEWSVGRLTETVKAHFFKVQEAWRDGDLETMQTSLTGAAREALTTEFQRQRSLGWTNILSDLSIEDIRFVHVQNFDEDSRDNFTVWIEAKARDYTLDAKGQVVMIGTFQPKRPRKQPPTEAGRFFEFWTFTRSEDGWLVSEISDWSGMSVQKAGRRCLNESEAA